jgi:predicted nuclease of predicted toxin-antitoxin system
MIKVLLDACIPRRLQKELTGFDVHTAQHAGLDQIPDGVLLDAIEGKFDVLVTRDRNLAYQQSLAGRSFAVVVVRSVDQSPTAFLALVPSLRHAISTAFPGTVTIVSAERHGLQ